MTSGGSTVTAKPRRDAKFGRGNQKGSALIITLLLISILIGLSVEFVYEVYIDSSSVSNWSNAQKASFTARSGQTLGAEYLSSAKGDSYTYEREVALPVERSFGPYTELEITINDESSKFNINSIIYPNGLTDEKALLSLKKLLEYLNINPNLSLVIADWIDPDDEPRLSDSENMSKNTFLWSKEELRVMEDVDKTIFNTLSPYITVHSDKLVNINTAELPVLVSLNRDITENLAQRIIDYRESTPFENKNYIVRVSGFEALGIQFLDKITVKSSHYRVRAKASVNSITRIIESVMDTALHVHFWREE